MYVEYGMCPWIYQLHIFPISQLFNTAMLCLETIQTINIHINKVKMTNCVFAAREKCQYIAMFSSTPTLFTCKSWNPNIKRLIMELIACLGKGYFLFSKFSVLRWPKGKSRGTLCNPTFVKLVCIPNFSFLGEVEVRFPGGWVAGWPNCDNKA